MTGDLRSAGQVDRPGFLRLAYATLAVNLAVVLWGAFVRATDRVRWSHWPRNGDRPRPGGDAHRVCASAGSVWH
jgi:hypothetical protein